MNKQKREEMLHKVNPTKILVKDIIEVTNKTATGIIIPDAVVKQTTMKAKVLIVGNGTNEIEIPYVTGDTVLFHPTAGRKFSYEGDELRLIDVSEVFLGGR